MFRYMKKVSELYATLGLPVWKKNFFSNHQPSQPRKSADILRDARHMEAAELFCANDKICSLFFNAPGFHLETWKFFHAVNTNHMPVSKQFFFRMSQGRMINVLKLGMNSPSDHDFPFLK